MTRTLQRGTLLKWVTCATHVPPLNEWEQLNTAYRAVLRERARKAATSASSRPPAKQQDDVQERTPPKASPTSSDSSTRSFKSASSSSNSTPSSTPFTTPSSSPYSSPASSPVSSNTSLPDEEDSASTKTSVACDDEDDQSSTACSSTTNHTAKPPSDLGSPSGGAPSSPKPPRAKLRKQNPKKSQKSSASSSSSSTSSHEYECHDTRSKPTYAASPTKNNSHSNGQPKTRDHSSKRNTKYKTTELKEYYNSFPSLKDFPKVDLDPEWTYPLSLTLEDIFHGKRVCYRIKRRYLTGKTKAVVLDVDVPPGCRAGTKIVFRDAGHERRDGMKQDLVFVVREVKHERFVRGHEWAGDEDEVRGERKDEDKDKGRERRKDPDKDRDRDEKNGDRKSRKHRKYREDDLVMDVRLPWVDRLKEEKAKVVFSGVDGKELVFEIDCRGGKGGSGKEKDGKMTGVYILENAGMPVRSNIHAGDNANKGAGAGTNEAGQRGRMIVRYVPLARIRSKLLRKLIQVGDICPGIVFLFQVGELQADAQVRKINE